MDYIFALAAGFLQSCHAVSGEESDRSCDIILTSLVLFCGWQ